MYHNKVATYRTMAISNYLRWLFFYEEEIIRISDLIDKRLNKE